MNEELKALLKRLREPNRKAREKRAEMRKLLGEDGDRFMFTALSSFFAMMAEYFSEGDLEKILRGIRAEKEMEGSDYDEVEPLYCPSCGSKLDENDNPDIIECSVCKVFLCHKCRRWRRWECGAADALECDKCWEPPE